MRFEIVLFLIATFIIANIYTDGKYYKKLTTYKKYYQMAGVAFLAVMIIWIFKKNPKGAKELLMASNEYVKYLPVDSNTSKYITPILDFTTKHNFSDENEYDYSGTNTNNTSILNPIKSNNIKRSVSESRKKFVASRGNWKCCKCGELLKHTYEIDHKIALKHGGSNEVDNLEALCPSCHKEKTSFDFI